MTTDESNACGEPSEVLPPQTYEGIDWGVIVLPYVSIAWVGLYWAAAGAVGVFILWVTVMPTTCMNGGLICSLVAIAVLFNTIGFLLGAGVRFVVSLFS